MAQKNDGGDKTERPTHKRLIDARKKGEVAKSKDVTSTVILIAWAVLGMLLAGYALRRMTQLFDLAFLTLQAPGPQAFETAIRASGEVFVLLSLAFFVPVAAIGLLTDFFQVGPVFQFERMKPKLEHMNPAEGLKRMFDADNLFEVGKSVLKTAILILVVLVVTAGQFRDLTALPLGDAGSALGALGKVSFQLVAATAAAFILIAALDASYQRFSFLKKMRMSHRDIRQELKDTEGDPMIRSQRRQLHQEWANRNAVEAARTASVLVVNPTHIAIALDYDPTRHPAPVVAAKGEGPLAMEMRQAAEAAGVPVVRNVDLARALNARAEVDEIVPEDMFAAVAEVILWAQRLRDEARDDALEGREQALVDARSPGGPA